MLPEEFGPKLEALVNMLDDVRLTLVRLETRLDGLPCDNHQARIVDLAAFIRALELTGAGNQTKVDNLWKYLPWIIALVSSGLAAGFKMNGGG